MTFDLTLEAFSDLAHRGGELPLDRGALEIARIAYPELDPAPSLGLLDRLAERTGKLARSEGGPLGLVSAINQSLFDREGFRGNEKDYFEPRNSFLNDVLERKLGIPITLSLIYIEVARRLGFRVQGIGFPGHFLVRAKVDGRDLFLDTFHRGQVLTTDDCQVRLDDSFGAPVKMDPHFLDPVGPRYMLGRMLRNLKSIYLSRRDYPRALAVVERLRLLIPEDSGELRDRGKLLLSLGDLQGAANDLEHFLADAPEPSEGSEVKVLLQSIRRRQALIN